MAAGQGTEAAEPDEPGGHPICQADSRHPHFVVDQISSAMR
jgi:hypothetical protein